MKRYQYRAIDREGKTVTGELPAKSEDDLLERLRAHDLTVIDVKEEESAAPAKSPDAGQVAIELDFGPSEKDIAFFTRQLATMLNAGLPLSRVFGTLYNQTKSKSLKGVIHQVAGDIQQGESITGALSKHRRVFGDMYLNMIKIGEASGTLVASVTKLAALIEKDLKTKKKIQAALAYPLFVMVFSAILSYALIAFIMPGFSPMFRNSGLDIPTQYPLTHLLMGLSELLTNPPIIALIIVLVVALIVTVKLMAKHPGGKLVLDTILFNLPFIHPMIRLGAVTRFCRSFATLGKAGIPMISALSLVAASVGNLVMTRLIEKVSKEIQEGDPISGAMRKAKVFPDLLLQMVSIGEETGDLPEMFDRTADYYDEELDAMIGALSSIIEPAMMIFVGIIVGLFIMGILLPILGISAQFT